MTRLLFQLKNSRMIPPKCICGGHTCFRVEILVGAREKDAGRAQILREGTNITMTPPPSQLASPPSLLREWSYNGPQENEVSPPVAPAVVVDEEESRQSNKSTPPQYTYPVATFVSSLLRNSIDHIYTTGEAETIDEHSQATTSPLPLSVRSEDVNAARQLHFTEQQQGISSRSAPTQGALSRYEEEFDEAEFVIVDGDLVAIPAPPLNEEEMDDAEFQSRPKGMRKSLRGIRKWIKRRTNRGKQQDDLGTDSQRQSKRKARRRSTRRRDSEPEVPVPTMAPITEVSRTTTSSSAVSAEFLGNADQALYPQAGVLGVASADAYIETDDKVDDVSATVQAEKIDVSEMLFLAREESDLEQGNDTLMDPAEVKSMMNDLETASKPQAKVGGCPLSVATSADRDVYNDTLKIVMVGDSVEKSILARALRNSHKMPRQRNTLGVDVHTWMHSDVNFSTWDIQGSSGRANANAGAHPSTQSLFFTPNSLYVLVWDLAANNGKAQRRTVATATNDDDEDDDEDDNEFLVEKANRRADLALEADLYERVLPWIDSIPASNSAILPVVTIPEGMDEFEVQRRCSMMQALLMNHLQSKEPKLIFGSESILRVDFDHGVGELQATIVAIATDKTERVFDHVGTPVSPATVEILEIVRRMREDHKVILLDHLLAEMSNICSLKEVMDSLHYLASLGELLYFGNDEDDLISRYIILSRKWLVSALSCILRNDLKRELSETRRFMNMQGAFSGQEYPENEILKTLLSGTNSSCPILTSADSLMLWQSMSFMREAADRSAQMSEATNSLTMFEFLERLLVHKGVFLPLDVKHQDDTTPVYFVPSLLAHEEPSDVWTYKSSESYMTTLCHSWLLRDGSPADLMERVSVALIQDLHEFSQAVLPPNPRRLQHTSTYPLGHGSMTEFLETHDSVGRVKIHHIMCWKSSLLVKVGCVFSEPDSGEIRESFSEIFVTLVDPQSVNCVSSNSIGSGMTRLVICGKGQAGHQGRKLWKGGYAVALDSIKASLANLRNVDRQVVCPDCLAHSHPTVASTWGWDDVRTMAQSGDCGVRCMRGHLVDTDLLCGTCKNTTQSPIKMPAMDSSRVSKPVSALLESVVVVGLWDDRSQTIRNVGSGFVVDKKLGLIVTAGHILFDMTEGRQFGSPYHGLTQGKAVIGVISDGSHTAKFRYFAEIVSHNITNIDACVLRITDKMEQDVDGVDWSDRSVIPLDLESIKAEKLQPLKLTRSFELEESVRIIGFNQGGENLLEQGKHVNRVVDFAKGYICKNFKAPQSHWDDSSSESSSSAMSWNPRQEIVVMMPTISGHSGGPCVNDDGRVVGILSRADPVDRQRCYLVPSVELKVLVNQAKDAIRMGPPIAKLNNKRGHTA